MKRLKTSWDDHYMFPAYINFLFWAVKDKTIMDDFRFTTGNTYTPSTSPLNQMIDSATGADFEFVQSFSEFCEKKYFGTPDSLQDA